jgi:hypothetical protein
MRRNYTFKRSWAFLIAMAMLMNFSFALASTAQNTSISTRDTSYYKKKNKQSYLKNGLSFSLPPIKPGIVSTVKINVPKADDKLLQDVDVFPNPATDQINFKFTLSHNTNVNIKIMDVLGNAVMNVMQQRLDVGEQKYTVYVANKLPRGFYFARITAGTESVIRRISIY